MNSSIKADPSHFEEFEADEEEEWPMEEHLKREPPTEVPPLEVHSAARRKLMNSSLAKTNFKKAVLEAAADLTHEFHTPYMNRLRMSEPGQNLLDAENPASTFETIKKGFLFHLNSTGHYLVVREHLRHAASHLIQQCGLVLLPNGFKNNKDFQNFLHDMYIFLTDEMHECLNETDVEIPATHGLRSSSVISTSEVRLKQLNSFAQEAMALGDWDNSQRLHLQRICLNSEAPQPWVEYALMWTARGEDRMAEIALREALKNDPNHAHALILTGLIAARHRDQRAVSFMGQALTLHPLSTAVMVMLAAVHSKLGNVKPAKFFFLKARLLQLLLKGEDVTKAEEDLNEFRNNPDGLKPEPTSEPDSSSRARSQKRSSKGKRKSGSSRDSKSSQKGSKNKNKDESSSRASDSGSAAKKKLSKERKGSNRKSHISSLVQDGEPMLTKEMTISGSDRIKAQSSAALKLNYDFPLVINGETVLKSKLPYLSRSLVYGWDVTKARRMSLMEGDSGSSLLSSNLHESQFRKFTQIDFDASDEELLLKYFYYVDNPEEPQEPYPLSKKASVAVSEPSSSRSAKKKKGSSSSKDRTPRGSKNNPETSKSSNKTPRSGRKKSQKNKPSDAKEIPTEPAVEKKSAPIPWTFRVGSEYIWAAQLLLQYNAHDFLDAMLARELHLTKERSVPFAYLLAASLCLRERCVRAKFFVDMLLQKPEHQANPYVSELKGHLEFAMGEIFPAIENYEKAVKFAEPEQDLQLTYLRLGTLYAQHKNLKLAKTIFLQGVNIYRSLHMWKALGNICLQQQNYTEAEAAFSQANQLDNTSPEIWGKLALTSLLQDNKTLAEQSYKWAIRFGLKPGPLMDEIKCLQGKRGYGDPSFPRVPNCIPHEFYLKRLGLNRPLDIYEEALASPVNSNSPSEIAEQIEEPGEGFDPCKRMNAASFSALSRTEKERGMSVARSSGPKRSRPSFHLPEDLVK